MKNDTLKFKHHLKPSDNQYTVYVQEQLTRERERTSALYHLKKEGFKVFTNECRLNTIGKSCLEQWRLLMNFDQNLARDDEKLKEVLWK